MSDAPKFLNADLDVVLLGESGIIDHISRSMTLVSSNENRYSFEIVHQPASVDDCISIIIDCMSSYPKKNSELNVTYSASIDVGIEVELKNLQSHFCLEKDTIDKLSVHKIGFGITIYNPNYR